MTSDDHYIKIEKLQSRISQLETDLKLANDELWRVKQLNIAMENTLSWKVTSPLRLIKRLTINLRKSAFGRIIYRLNILKTRLQHHLQSSKGNQAAVMRMVSSRHSVLRSDSHRAIYSALCTPPKNFPYIDMSVVTYNNGRWITTFISSLINQDYPVNKINLFIVDNSSTDNTRQVIEQELKKHEHLFAKIDIQSAPNNGFGAGHHQAITKGTSDFLIVSNIDIEFRKDAIVKLMATAMNDAADVACWEIRQAPFEHPKYIDPISLEVNWASHCFVLMRRKAYEGVGGYDKSIFMYGEDVEMSYRFISRGWKIRCVPSAVLDHYTYKEAGEVKPVQFIGSIYANGLIRIRYGNWWDIVAAFFLQFGLLFNPLPVGNVKKTLFKNAIKLLIALPKERLKFIKLRGSFPFRGFDFDMRREGAFYDISNTVKSGPLVSVITRTYKGREHFLRECIASVINQTYTNIEHVIVEDGGNSHAQLIEQIKADYPQTNIRYYSQDKLGRSAAGNKGLNEASGEFLVFLDDDDLFLHDHVEILATELITNKEIVAAYSLAWEVKTDTHPNGYKEHQYLTEPVFYQEFSEDVLLHHNYIPIQSIIFRKAVYLERGGFDEGLDQLEDWNLWVKYSISNKFKWICKTTSLYRTPYSTDIAIHRKKLLDECYGKVCDKNKQLFDKYRESV